MFTIKTILSVLLLLITSTSFAAGPFVKGELLVQQAVKATKANVDKAIKANGGTILDEIPQIRVKRIRVPEKNFAKVKAALAKNPNFTFVEENFLAQGMIVPNDPSFPSQWHHTKIMTPSAWEMGVGSAAIPIAIIDSGVDPDHPDLMAKLHARLQLSSRTITIRTMSWDTAQLLPALQEPSRTMPRELPVLPGTTRSCRWLFLTPTIGQLTAIFPVLSSTQSIMA